MACNSDQSGAFFATHMSTSVDRGVGDGTKNQAVNDKIDTVAPVSKG